MKSEPPRSPLRATKSSCSSAVIRLSLRHAISTERLDRWSPNGIGSRRSACRPADDRAMRRSLPLTPNVSRDEQCGCGFAKVEPQTVEHPAQHARPRDIERDACAAHRRRFRRHAHSPRHRGPTRRQDEQFLPHALAQFVGSKNRTSDEVSWHPASAPSGTLTISDRKP